MKTAVLLLFCLVQATAAFAKDPCDQITPRQAFQEGQNNAVLQSTSQISEEAATQGFQKSNKDLDNVFSDCTFDSFKKIQEAWDKLQGLSSLLNEGVLQKMGEEALKNMLEQIFEKAKKKACDALNSKLNALTPGYDSQLSDYYRSYGTSGNLSRTASSRTSSIVDSMFKNLVLPTR